jgi:hypothetical protein
MKEKVICTDCLLRQLSRLGKSFKTEKWEREKPCWWCGSDTKPRLIYQAKEDYI